MTPKRKMLSSNNNNENTEVTVRVLTYNIFLRPLGITTNGNDFKNDRLESFLCQDLSKYDIICFQELFGSFSSRRDKMIIEMYRLGFMYHFESQNSWMSCPFFLIDGGLVTFSRYPIIESQQLIFDKGKHADALAAKGVLYTQIEIDDGHLINVYNLHLQSVHKHQDVREGQLRQFRDFFYETTSPNTPSLVCGDFNIDCKHEVRYSTLRDMLTFDFYHTENVLEAIYNDDEINEMCTYGDCGKDLCLTSKQDHYKDEIIDYIWVIDLNSKKVEVLEANIQPFYVYYKPYTQLSDHYGIETTIRLSRNDKFVYV